MENIKHKDKKKISSEVEAWLSGYEMPVNIYSVISALDSLGYMSGKVVNEKLGFVGMLKCDECQHTRNVADYILEKCENCGDPEHVIQWLT